MRVALDARCLNTGHLRGMGKAAYELVREACAYDDLDLVLFGDEPSLPMHHPPNSRISCCVWEVRGHRFRAWEQIGLPWRARRLACDVLHAPATWCPYWQPLPVVVTVHDTLPWIEDPPSPYLHHALPAAYKRARAIITASHSSKRDILDRWPELASKLHVIPHGIPERYLNFTAGPVDGTLEAAGVRPPYLLYIGGELPRKRPDWAVRIWRALDRHDVRLVMCGLADPEHASWAAELAPGWRERLACLPFVPEERMPALYANAAAVLYSTLYEGFGFPALEAQAVGTPVLMSEAGSLRELGGPGAILLPVDDLREWIAATRSVLEGNRPDSAAARRWASRFSGREAFRKTLKVYESAAAA